MADRVLWRVHEDEMQFAAKIVEADRNVLSANAHITGVGIKPNM